jgi:hypothetical protein
MDELNQLRDQLAASEAARQLSDEYWGKLSELLKNGGMDDPAFVYGQVKATVEMLSGAEVARQQAEQEPFCEFCQSTEPSPMQVCTKCWNSANNDTWQRRAISAEAEVSDLRAQIARLQAEPSNEEMVPHAFKAKVGSFADTEGPIWCAHCEYHRDFEIHRVPPPQEAEK